MLCVFMGKRLADKLKQFYEYLSNRMEVVLLFGGIVLAGVTAAAKVGQHKYFKTHVGWETIAVDTVDYYRLAQECLRELQRQGYKGGLTASDIATMIKERDTNPNDSLVNVPLLFYKCGIPDPYELEKYVR